VVVTARVELTRRARSLGSLEIAFGRIAVSILSCQVLALAAVDAGEDDVIDSRFEGSR
jgi:hypothetical protein